MNTIQQPTKNNKKTIGRQFTVWTMGVLATIIVLMFLFSFSISYVAQRELASALGITGSFFGLFPLSYFFPLIIDGFILTGVVASLYAAVIGEQGPLIKLATAIVFTFTILSMVINGLHSLPYGVAAVGLGIVVPLVVFISSELMRLLIQNVVERETIIRALPDYRLQFNRYRALRAKLKGEIASLQAGRKDEKRRAEAELTQAQAEAEAKRQKWEAEAQARLDELEQEIERKRSEAGDTYYSEDEVKQIVQAAVYRLNGKTLQDTADVMGISVSTVRRRLSVLNGTLEKMEKSL